ncbi:Hypothetical Protein FCC1311_049262 [Hondaea fermentalgiana]|uniref:Uncharacterized protein n=1 Tax=Hondaea fermentalgiana TaxID=2315210 RepID=A0A2R5GDR5_9STRA|nr:Hypothetical Protein FCC1311_049262 [Hondaea fermentalgiana]|eukprot:GBG28705.1 Hypothetical Protein FCC1311_049262 [Hondaea fermentalgiana]
MQAESAQADMPARSSAELDFHHLGGEVDTEQREEQHYKQNLWIVSPQPQSHDPHHLRHQHEPHQVRQEPWMMGAQTLDFEHQGRQESWDHHQANANLQIEPILEEDDTTLTLGIITGDFQAEDDTMEPLILPPNGSDLPLPASHLFVENISQQYIHPQRVVKTSSRAPGSFESNEEAQTCKTTTKRKSHESSRIDDRPEEKRPRRQRKRRVPGDALPSLATRATSAAHLGSSADDLDRIERQRQRADQHLEQRARNAALRALTVAELREKLAQAEEEDLVVKHRHRRDVICPKCTTTNRIKTIHKILSDRVTCDASVSSAQTEALDDSF